MSLLISIKDADALTTMPTFAGANGHVSITSVPAAWLGDVDGDAPGLVAGELGPRHRLPAHGEKSASLRRHDNVSAREETTRRRELIALMGASVSWPFAAMAQQAG